MNDFYLEVLEQYEGETFEVRKGRGAWICGRSDGVKLLKEYRGTVKRLEFEEYVLDQLRAQGISRVDQYVRNREDSLLTVAGDGTKYILKDWFCDRECSLRDTREILTAVSWIGRLHKALRTIAWQESWDLASMQTRRPDEEMERHTRELKRARNFIRGKRKKSEFELMVMKHFDSYFEQALAAGEGLKTLLSQGSGAGNDLCHGDLNQHHILNGEQGVAFIEFSQLHRGSQVSDLYHFMRKAMEKHGWNEQLGLSMLEAYERLLPMEKEERTCLYYLFLYPEKYWKQLNYYFNANKAWIPDKNVEKLRGLDAQQEGRNSFLKQLRDKIS